MDGAGFADQPAKLKELFPDFPYTLAVPGKQKAIWFKP